MTFTPDHPSAIVRPSPNFNDRRHPLDMLVLHYTGMESAEDALKWLCMEESQVSSHYLVMEDGTVYQMVPEEKRAWHAGVSSWEGGEDLNSRSVGIEIVNAGHEFGLPPFPHRQIEAVVGLSQDILARWPVPPHRIVGHSDIAPGRKRDPGEKFPWKTLFENGIGLWVEPAEETPFSAGLGDAGSGISELKRRFRSLGYGVSDTDEFDEDFKNVVTAFQRRFLPERVTGEVCGVTPGTLEKLIQQKRSYLSA